MWFDGNLRSDVNKLDLVPKISRPIFFIGHGKRGR